MPLCSFRYHISRTKEQYSTESNKCLKGYGNFLSWPYINFPIEVWYFFFYTVFNKTTPFFRFIWQVKIDWNAQLSSKRIITCNIFQRKLYGYGATEMKIIGKTEGFVSTDILPGFLCLRKQSQQSEYKITLNWNFRLSNKKHKRWNYFKEKLLPPKFSIQKCHFNGAFSFQHQSCISTLQFIPQTWVELK